MAMPMEDLTRQDRKVLANLIEHLPLHRLSTEVKQAFVGNTASMEWLADQMKLFPKAQADVKSLIINCNVMPLVPSGLTMHHHCKHGKLTWDKTKFTDQKFLYLSEGQKDGKLIIGNKLREELRDRPVVNACVLDWLLANQEQIPDEWKGGCIFFWGTIYSDSDGDLCVRYLCWDGTRWISHYYWLDDDLFAGNPALLAK